jgi:hypothetical protein
MGVSTALGCGNTPQIQVIWFSFQVFSPGMDEAFSSYFVM